MTGDEAERLAAANLWRCRAVAKRMTYRTPWERDEAESVALVALAMAVRTFDPHEDEFGTYAHRAIERRVINHLHSLAPKGYRFRNGEERPGTPVLCQMLDIATDAGTFDVAGDPPVGWALEWEDFVRGLARRLPLRLEEVILGRYLYADAHAVQGRLGVGEERIKQLHREALAMLREHYTRKEGAA